MRYLIGYCLVLNFPAQATTNQTLQSDVIQPRSQAFPLKFEEGAVPSKFGRKSPGSEVVRHKYAIFDSTRISRHTTILTIKGPNNEQVMRFMYIFCASWINSNNVVETSQLHSMRMTTPLSIAWHYLYIYLFNFTKNHDNSDFIYRYLLVWCMFVYSKRHIILTARTSRE